MRFKRLAILGVLLVSLLSLVAGAAMAPIQAQEMAPTVAPDEEVPSSAP